MQAEGKVTAEKEVEILAGETSADAGTIPLSDAVSITGTLKLDRDANGVTGEDVDRFEPFQNQWGWWDTELRVWVDAHNKQGPGWGNAEAVFEYPQEQITWNEDGSITFAPGLGDHTTTFTINIPPPSKTATYQVNFQAEGYAAVPIEVAVDASGKDVGTVVLTKASILTGTVSLPTAVADWRNIDVQAIDTNDQDVRYWGWGNIDPNDQNSPEADRGKQGNFRIDGIPEGTYTLEVRVMGYVMSSQQITVTQGQDLDVGTITLSEGSKVIGTLTVQGDTTNLRRWEEDDEDPMRIWIDAWSPTGWGGTDISVPRGVNQSVTYTIGGLSSGTFEIHCGIGEGYELVDENGNSPVMVTLASNAEKNLVLKPFEGVLTGTITGDGITLDLSKVVVEVKRPWDWLPPKIATVANGGIDAGSATYTVTGLGTGDYVVKAGMYDGWMDWSSPNPQALDGYTGEGFLVPSADVGVHIERVFVQNDATSPTTADITLGSGYAISGTVSLSPTDPPWHDFGDGTFQMVQGKPPVPGDPNGRKDLNQDPQLSEAISMAGDVEGMPVMAMPMEMMFMGGEDPRMGVIQGDGTYQIPGLSPGVYIVMPPANSQRIAMLSEGTTGWCTNPDYTTREECLAAPPEEGTEWIEEVHSFEGGEETHHWTTLPQMVVITDNDVSDIDFAFGNGHTISGRLTLPEAQTATEGWDDWMWVGHLELQTPQQSFMGHGRPLYKKDFEDGSSYDFTFHHVADGDYLVRFWTDRYVPGGAKVTVNGANVSTNLNIEKGANLVGKLVDAVTGEAVTSADGVTVICEAVPWVEGSWRETCDDDWSQSYIESDEGLKTGNLGGTEGQRENKTPGKFHLTALPTGHKYVVVVETTADGNKIGGAKNYVGRVIAGIDVPEGATGDIDVGTIKLKEGTTIKGRLTDSGGNGIPGVEVCALPSDTHDGTAEAEGVSDTQGYYTIYGINGDVEYYDLIAAERPDFFEDWGKKIEWGEKRKYNVPPGTTDANFTLQRATSTLSGTLTIPEGAQFMSPFRGEGETFPAAILILQRKGVVYKDMLDGIEVMSMPAPSDASTTTYTIDHVAPGTYKLLAMNYGLPTQVIDDLTIAEGSNTQDVTWTSTGYTISGACGLSAGGYPSSADINGVVCMNTGDQSLIFGQLTDQGDGTYSAYEVPRGLQMGRATSWSSIRKAARMICLTSSP